jgi:hypothetical protein
MNEHKRAGLDDWTQGRTVSTPRTSRELAHEIALIHDKHDACALGICKNYLGEKVESPTCLKIVALIDAYVRVREAEAVRTSLDEAHRRMCNCDVMEGRFCTLLFMLRDAESALLTARKQLGDDDAR